MFGYYFNLALRSFKRNKALTALMVLAIAMGIAACMTTLTVFRVLSGDPIPEKSERLFYVQLDPASARGMTPGEEPEGDGVKAQHRPRDRPAGSGGSRGPASSRSR